LCLSGKTNHKKMKQNILTFCIVICLITNAFSQKKSIKIPLLKDEKVWSGFIKAGHEMPLKVGYKLDLYGYNEENQSQPLLLTNKGRYVWSEEPFAYEIGQKEIIITNNKGKIETAKVGNSLAEGRKAAEKLFFPTSGKTPDLLLFSAPQYNTWIELTYNQNQADILKYAHAIIDNGYPAGVLMIDDTWQEDYGKWNFHPGRFPNPKAMMDELHQMGFKVMVWVCPFLSADQTMELKKLRETGGFITVKKNDNDPKMKKFEPAIIRWWNGYSAEIDLTHPEGFKWFQNKLDILQKEYGVDGFKFDAGDMPFYPDWTSSYVPSTPNQHCESWAKLGLKYPLNEYRACWKMAGQPLAQRLHDKRHDWSDLQKLIPHMLTEGLVGYTFSCPDMIGGGAWTSFLDNAKIDQDLVVRSAQCHALMPMMQFSVAPWRILDKAHHDAIKKSVELRKKYTPLIMQLVDESAKTGGPIIKYMEYVFPNQGFENVKDQYMLGDKVLVAPVQNKGNERSVVLPKGKWKADDEQVFEGGKTIKVNVPIDRLPYFLKID
jgi:alpha-glucosidase (family GH31 glycosyl hydrolase)